MSTSVSTSIDFRPIRSPKWPMTTPPSGRATKPTAYVPKAARVPVERRERREEDLVEDQRRRRAVEEEVVPLDGGAGKAGKGDASEWKQRFGRVTRDCSYVLPSVTPMRLFKIRQRFDAQELADPHGSASRPADAGSGGLIRPGARVAIAVGSRGIDNLAAIVREVAV